jgi:hypothetical protein
VQQCINESFYETKEKIREMKIIKEQQKGKKAGRK